MKLNSIFTVLVFACLVLSGCAYKGDLTPEKAYGAIGKFMAGKGSFTIIDDETNETVKADHKRAFKPGSSGGDVHFVVRNFTGTDKDGKSLTIPEGLGTAGFIKSSSGGGWYLNSIYITINGVSPLDRYFYVGVDQTIY